MTQTTALEVARALLDIRAVGFSPDAPRKFKSGIISPVYVDNRRLPFHPPQWHTIIDSFAAVIGRQAIASEVIAGVAVGGVPHSAALAYHLKRPSIFIRKEAKGHGNQQRIEGGDVQGLRVILIEDLVTTGGSSLDAVDALRNAGALVDDVLAIVSYGFKQACDAFTAAKIHLHTLTNFDVILTEALDRGIFDHNAELIIRDWFEDAPGWAVRQGLQGKP